MLGDCTGLRPSSSCEGAKNVFGIGLWAPGIGCLASVNTGASQHIPQPAGCMYIYAWL